ncbi:MULTISPECIES: mycofactocin biosynthesis peptidyl-dipeptidase MftE [Paenarthrobacter]|uniref:Mycofactocin biosynthesis peptidyl-dipeptidase MftE n=1 Tax=Paenarthrobacter aromaticivorans TaxID=2849150 RepID=A0ABS6IAY5_9MICC|nr:mycofactocin biosynthesis peptidyl-dipeptidase MftE [Paenarthrobacter sp. MMS21-TAE1-1]MBU8868517.1 mycofactocin biosynthesis peptidyl-dipeptidase MftE [Paenarthrobacter sp. MMS21-TAE1-1]
MTTAPHLLGNLTWQELHTRPLVLVPLGSTEQHGPHLPIDTDTVVAAALAVALAGAIAEETPQGVVVAPAVSYGASGEHQSFPGTTSIGLEALRILVVELVRSLSTWAGPVILVNGHGGNVSALSAAVQQLIAEKHDVAWLPCTPRNGDLHAGKAETSLMLHLQPESVRAAKCGAGDKRSLAEILPLLQAGGVGSVSPSGVLGDPTDATADEGRKIFHEMVVDSQHRCLHGRTNIHGMLTLQNNPASTWVSA